MGPAAIVIDAPTLAGTGSGGVVAPAVSSVGGKGWRAGNWGPLYPDEETRRISLPIRHTEMTGTAAVSLHGPSFMGVGFVNDDELAITALLGAF